MALSKAGIGLLFLFHASSTTADVTPGGVNPPPSSATPAAVLTIPEIPRDTGGMIHDRDMQAAWNTIETGAAGHCSALHYRRDKPLVIIDPGHGGGRDKGSVSVSGITETRIVDPVARHVAEEMRAAGYDVAFTRLPGENYRYDRWNENIGVRHIKSNQSRAEFALQLAKITGHLSVKFVSIHADAHPTRNPSVRGATFFAASAENNNGLSDFGGAPLNSLSVTFGETIAKNYRIAPGVRTLRNTADFDVIAYLENRSRELKIPAVGGLLEIGHATSPEDERIMRNAPQDLGIKIAHAMIRHTEPDFSREDILVASIG